MKPKPSLIYIMLACIYSFAIPVLAQQESETKPVTTSSNLFDAFANGQVKAMFRYSTQYRDSNLHLLQDSSEPDVSDEKIQQYSAIGGFVGYETAPWFHTTIGATIYGALPFGSNPDDRRGLGGLYEEDGGQDAYAALGEMFIKFQNENHLIKVGRQEMPDYRMVSLSNIRFSPITHSGAFYENRMFENLGINLGYIRRMKERNATEFIDMAKGASLKESANGKQLIRGDYNAGDYDDTRYIGDEKEMTMQGLSLQFRLAYNNYRTDYNFEAYREIHGYDFQSVTKDFFDARLYLDYHF